MSEHYRRGLVDEYRSLRETGQPDRAGLVLAELERTGGVPDGLLEDAADHTNLETAVEPRRGRPRTKEN